MGSPLMEPAGQWNNDPISLFMPGDTHVYPCAGSIFMGCALIHESFNVLSFMDNASHHFKESPFFGFHWFCKTKGDEDLIESKDV
jgi:hypothetical protein